MLDVIGDHRDGDDRGRVRGKPSVIGCLSALRLAGVVATGRGRIPAHLFGGTIRVPLCLRFGDKDRIEVHHDHAAVFRGEA